MATPNPTNPTLNNTFTPTLTKRVGHGGPISPTEHDNTITGLEAKIAELVDHVERIKTGEYLKTGAVDTDHLTNLKVTTDKLADLSVTGAKIANDTVTGTQLSNIANVAGEYTAGQVKLTVDGQGRVSGTEVLGSTTQADGLFDAVTDYAADTTAGLVYHPIDTSLFPAYTLGSSAGGNTSFASLLAGSPAIRLPSPEGKYWWGPPEGHPEWVTSQYYKSGSGGSATGYNKIIRVQFGPYVPDTAKAVHITWSLSEAHLDYYPLAASYIPSSGGQSVRLGTNGTGNTVLPLHRHPAQFLSTDWLTTLSGAVANWRNEWATRVYDVRTGSSTDYQGVKDLYRGLGAAKTTSPEEGLGDYSWTHFCPSKPFVPLYVSSSEPNNTFSLVHIDLHGYWV
jgi:hypothetical protein